MSPTYGIICFRPKKDKHKWEIMMVSRLVSYPYSDFIMHRYEWPNNTEAQQKILQTMFNNMTAIERAYIISLNFNNMWFLRWMSDPELNPQISERARIYAEKQEIFKKRFINGNNREKIISAMANSKNISPLDLYEIPKGHPKDGETSLDSAIREFEEETLLKRLHLSFVTPNGDKLSYREVCDMKKDPINILSPIRYDFTAADNHKIYTTYYYIAVTDAPILPSIKIDGIHPIEISDIKWILTDDQILKKYTDILKSAISRITC
jgi:8-oxo-dGTP pyrophosphatase MutT (NUDIX family)